MLPSPKTETFAGSAPSFHEKDVADAEPFSWPLPAPGLVFGCRAGEDWRLFSESDQTRRPSFTFHTSPQALPSAHPRPAEDARARGLAPALVRASAAARRPLPDDAPPVRGMVALAEDERLRELVTAGCGAHRDVLRWLEPIRQRRGQQLAHPDLRAVEALAVGAVRPRARRRDGHELGEGEVNAQGQQRDEQGHVSGGAGGWSGPAVTPQPQDPLLFWWWSSFKFNNCDSVLVHRFNHKGFFAR